MNDKIEIVENNLTSFVVAIIKAVNDGYDLNHNAVADAPVFFYTGIYTVTLTKVEEEAEDVAAPKKRGPKPKVGG